MERQPLFLKEVIMGKRLVNPYLPSWEYIPDGEPYVFEGRVYVYGSHDRFNGQSYCMNDYVCWSAPEEDPGDWRYEGVIYKKTDDPLNPEGEMRLFAPDVTRGLDGRYYLYYVLNRVSIVSVAVCDSPAGKYEFYGYVHYPDGTRLGEREGDEPQFDPGVLTEGAKTYLYTGFCPADDAGRSGPMVTVLCEDMLTVLEEPRTLIPSAPYSAGSGFEGHEFFEAPSIRRRGGTYYFIYSSIVFHELCYAVSESPTEGFVYGGVIVSNNDMNIDTYKPADRPMFYGGNNHGSIVQIKEDWFIFYHRHTNGTNFSRQGCVERIRFREDGSIPQVEMTSCAGLAPLPGRGEYPAYLACNLFCDTQCLYTGIPGERLDERFPKITQDGEDGDENAGYIENMKDGATAGFKYFDCKGIKRIGIKTRGNCEGFFEVKTEWDGDALGRIPAGKSSQWREVFAELAIPDGVHALYFTYRGRGGASLGAILID